MSWSVDFVAKNKSRAKAEVEKTHAPLLVKALLVDAIDKFKDDPFVLVKGAGHQATGTDYEISSCQFEVRPVRLVE